MRRAFVLLLLPSLAAGLGGCRDAELPSSAPPITRTSLLADANARTTRGAGLRASVFALTPQAVGDVVAQWTAGATGSIWGIGYDGNVWLSDLQTTFPSYNFESTTAGTLTGRRYAATWAGSWPGDMAEMGASGKLCQVNVGGNNGINCWDKSTGIATDSIRGNFTWTDLSQRGLAYRGDDDSFYIGGWNVGMIFHVAGLSHAAPGAVLDSCRPATDVYPSAWAIAGLAWNPLARQLWVTTNSVDDLLYRLDPATCTIVSTLAFPDPASSYRGAGLALDRTGDLWVPQQVTNKVFLVQTGVPADTPPEAIAALDAAVGDYGLPAGTTTALRATLNVALSALAAGKTGVACQALQAFIKQVEALSGKKLTAAQADALIADAERIRAMLGC